MHWFYVENSQIEEDKIRICGSDVNHIKNVLRMQPGERIVICNGEGKDFYCQIAEISSEEVVAQIEEMNDTESELPAKIYLFQGIPKKDKMELIIQKAVELGVYEVIPVAMKRCVAKIEEGKKEKKKLERWQSIAVSAAKQSGRGIIPKVHAVLSFKEALQYAKELETVIVPYELADGMEETSNIIKESVKKQSIGIFIGPEGGFDEKEIEEALQLDFHTITLGKRIALQLDFQTITLGKRILRTETAGLTILSILMFELEQKRVFDMID